MRKTWTIVPDQWRRGWMEWRMGWGQKLAGWGFWEQGLQIFPAQEWWHRRSKRFRLSSPALDYPTWRDRFLLDRLNISMWLVLVASLTFMPVALGSATRNPGVHPQVVLWIFLLLQAGVISCLALQRTSWGKQHPGWLFLGFSWSLTLVEQVIATLHGYVSLSQIAWTLTFLTQATLMPVRWPLHVISQLGVFGYCFGVNSLLGITQLADKSSLWSPQKAMTWLYLFWFCVICDLAVYLYERLQRSEFEAHRQLQVFLHGVSHDLRNPVTGMLMVLKNLLDQPGERVTVPRGVLERMIKGSDRQRNLINSLLEAYSSDVHGIICHCEPLSLPQLMQSAIADLEPLLTQSQTTIVNHIPEDLPLVFADPLQLWRVLTNLLTNALSHNPPGLTLTLNATAGPKMLRCAIADNGIGMTTEQSQRLFELYTRGPQHHQSIGLGLGLYLSRQIIAAQGGEIGVTSSPGAGAMFWFTLPLADAIAANPPA